jgi:hypothetical protein
MGFATEINYIVKSSSSIDARFPLEPGNIFTIVKRGRRVYIMGSPLMFADHTWTVRGMCVVTDVTINSHHETRVTVRLLTVFSESERNTATRMLKKAREALGAESETAESQSSGPALPVEKK